MSGVWSNKPSCLLIRFLHYQITAGVPSVPSAQLFNPKPQAVTVLRQRRVGSRGASPGVPQLGEVCGGAGCKCTSVRPAAESSPMWTRAVAWAARAARSSWGVAEGREAAEPAESSSGQAPRAKRSQRRSSSAGGMSESPPKRWRSMRGARQESFPAAQLLYWRLAVGN